MKLFIFILCLMLSKFTYAAIVEVNSDDQKIYYHPTPTLVLNLTDLGSDGGLLTVFLDYNGAEVKAEYNQIKNQYPAYEVQVVGAEVASSTARFEIPKAGYYQDLLVRNGQVGPYLNANLELNKNQVEQIKNAIHNGQGVNLFVKAKTSYNTSQVIERYQLEPTYCNDLKFRSVSDLVSKFATLRRPKGIIYSQTFDSLKQSILEQCFDIDEANLKSFSDLLKLKLSVNSQPKLLVGKYIENLNVEKNIDLKPRIQFDSN